MSSVFRSLVSTACPPRTVQNRRRGAPNQAAVYWEFFEIRKDGMLYQNESRVQKTRRARRLRDADEFTAAIEQSHGVNLVDRANLNIVNQVLRPQLPAMSRAAHAFGRQP